MSAPLSTLLVRWENAEERGLPLTPEQLCQGRPELVGALSEAIAALRRMRRLGAAVDVSDPTLMPDGPPRTDGPERPAPPPAGSVPAGYEILGELGRGGMGVVYRAKQRALNRVVALKMILAGSHAGRDERARLLAEAEAIARVKHPGIVQVYDFGELHGLPYLCLELCEGGSLADRLRDAPLAPRAAAEMAERVARAVQAAHEAGVVHRDLKPGNVLIGADGLPRVTDFGLSRRIDGDSQSVTGAVLGTPSYMAPEQARGEKGVGPAADVWALGAILYECLTGRPPFKAASVVDTMRQVTEDEPVPLRRLSSRAPTDLETVCHKCLQKDPARRYASAGDAADDLRRWLEGRPITARPVGPLGRLWRWCRREPLTAALVSAVLAALAGGMATADVLWWRAVASERQAKANEREATAARNDAENELAEAVRQRDRAHFHLESFLNLERFGRSLARRPLRKDFDLRVRLMQGGREKTRSMVASDEFDHSLPFQLEVNCEADCHLAAFYSIPPSGKQGARCLLVCPAPGEAERFAVDQTRTVATRQPRGKGLSPVVTAGEPAFLYFIASERGWEAEPDETDSDTGLPAFSARALPKLARRVKGLAEDGDPARDGRVSEEIFIFNVRRKGGAK
jgi:serine/threonine-protein kinase